MSNKLIAEIVDDRKESKDIEFLPLKITTNISSEKSRRSASDRTSLLVAYLNRGDGYPFPDSPRVRKRRSYGT